MISEGSVKRLEWFEKVSEVMSEIEFHRGAWTTAAR